MPAELATLSHAMGAMGHRLRGMIEATIEEARTISTSASDLSAMSEEVAASSHEIVRSIAGVTTGAEQQVQEVRNAESLLASILESAAQDVAATERVVALGESTRKLTGTQGGALSETGTVINQLREALQLAVGEAKELRRAMDAVVGVVETATQLTTQSEVLALNASVEAARHPTGGEGFAAVAQETRRLSDASRTAAERVGGTVALVRQRTEALTSLLHGATSQVLATETALQRSAVALQEIGRLVEAMRDIAERVARSAEESRAVAGRFAELRAQLEGSAAENTAAGESVTAAASQQSEATDDIAKSAAGLLEASERLATQVAGFQI
jgi:methyl-accepting chemotaxis protein